MLWDSEKQTMWMEVNGKRFTGELRSTVNLTSSRLYLGSHPHRGYYAEGYFDRIAVYKATDPAKLLEVRNGKIRVAP